MIDGINYYNDYDNLTPSEVACTLSHLKAIYIAYEKGYEKALILEDDVLFYLLPFWTEDIDAILQKAPKDWEVIRLFAGGKKILLYI